MARKAIKGETKNPTIRITKQAKDMLVDWLDANKKPDQGLVVDQIVRWFASQHEIVQAVVMGNAPHGLGKAYADALRRMADDLESGLNIQIVMGSTPPPQNHSKRSAVPNNS